MNKLSQFTEAQAAVLSAFFGASGRPEGSMSYCELAGFLFAVSCSPDLIQPSEWLPVVLNESEGGLASLDEAQEVLPAIMALYNFVNDGVLDGEPKLPPGCTTLAEPIANLEPDAPLSQWARGMAGGHGWLENVWDEYIPDSFDEEFGGTLMVLSFFASRKLAEEFRAEINSPDKPLGKLAGEMLELLPDAMCSYAQIGRAIYQSAGSERGLKALAPKRVEKVGRNELCPCGSGKKFKKCCGATLH